MRKVREVSVTKKSVFYGDSFLLPGKNKNKIILAIVLIGKGCRWARQGGGCSMCGFYNVTAPDNYIAPGTLYKQFLNEIEKYKNINSEISLLIYTSGSFLDNEEVNTFDQHKILGYVSQDKRIRQVDLESLPRYINEEKLVQIKNNLKGTKFGISIGLESADEKIRNYIIHKDFFTNKDLTKVSKLVKKYAELKFNIILKPPLLTEKEAIRDVLKTISFAKNLEADFLYIAACNVQRYTLNYYLWRKGNYQPPSLWSLYTIAKSLQKDKTEIVFGGFYDYPEPVKISDSCEKCRKKIIASLTNYPADFVEVDCLCKRKWEKRISVMAKDELTQRINNLYKDLETGRVTT